MNFITFHIINKLKPINYYLGGMSMPERKYSSTSQYRYGFNGHEKDDEVKDYGNHLSFGDYGYDTRIGRRWNIEPLIKKYPSNSSYLVFGNNPVLFADPDGMDWILSTGNRIYWYSGKTGDKSNLLQTFKATSGYKGPDIYGKQWDLQNSKYQKIKNGGPTSEGKYHINLKPDPDRVAIADTKTGEIMKNKDGGIEKLPSFVENPNKPGSGWTYSEWGRNRAALVSDNVTGASNTERDNNSFYLHDSEKGYTHGCTEVQTELFDKLKEYRNAGNDKIDVVVKYPSKDHNTNGGTKASSKKKD